MAPRRRKCATRRTSLCYVAIVPELFVPGLAASTPQLLTHLHHRLMPKTCDQEHLPEVKGAVLTRSEVVLRIPGCQSDFRMRFGFSSERFLIRSRSYVHKRRWLRARG
jgi:hypothetical protein